MTYLIHTIFIVLLGLVTFFGLGPVLFADGAIQERIITAAAVLLIYILLIFLYRKSLKWVEK